MPTVYVEIELPNGHIYKAEGNNKREAKQTAAMKALEKEFGIKMSVMRL